MRTDCSHGLAGMRFARLPHDYGQPTSAAFDKTFGQGRIGIGSFDDIRVCGKK